MPTQQNLFNTEPEPWEADDAEERLVATVVFAQGPPKEYDYLVPEKLRAEVQVGCRLRVPLGQGNRALVGWCVAVETKRVTQRRLKEVRECLDETSLLSPSMVRTTRWIAEHYLCELGQVLEAVVPAGVRDRAGTRLTTLLTVPTSVAARITQLDLPKKQLQVLTFLAASPQPLTPAQLALQANCTSGPITSLRRKGLIEATTKRLRQSDHAEPAAPREDDHVLNAEQQAALDAILAALNAGQHESILLHGITGSGKTEVYIRAIQEVVAYGRQAIVLVPEISLTPQTRQRFRARFNDVAVLHSHLSDAERHYHWERIARGEVTVVVGARSAVFAPVPRLGLVVIDEEHETTFKQETAPRYHARDVALFRARDEKVPLVLGSATPSLESWQRAQRGECRLIELPKRVLDRPLPDVVTVDLRLENDGRGFYGSLSRPLVSAMQDALRREGQVILLLNRRGFSTHIQCPSCGEVVKCPNCDLALTHHRHTNLALCHYCDYELPAPTICPKCTFPGINYGGLGTQRLEAEVRARFPEHKCLRMDTDSMQGPGSHERALAQFRAGEVQVLVGTQMIAKGLDFPNVTLVGVVNADTALHLPDFRAAERTFQLLVQVAGRTGRGDKGGRVLVQTFNPDNAAIQAAVRHDFHRFAKQELDIRKAVHYPPFASMARLVIRGPVQAVAEEFATSIAELVRKAFGPELKSARVLGPAPAPIAKLRGLYRFQIQVQHPDGDLLRASLRQATHDLKAPDEVQWIVDVDPLEML